MLMFALNLFFFEDLESLFLKTREEFIAKSLFVDESKVSLCGRQCASLIWT